MQTNIFNTIRAQNDATRAVIARLCGERTVEEIVCEFYGLSPDELSDRDALYAKRVGPAPRLQEL